MHPFGLIDWNNPDNQRKTLDNLASLLNTAINAVKTTSPNTKIIIHVGDYALKTSHDSKTGKDVPLGLWFFQQLEERNVNYEIAAASFYMYYHHKEGDYLDINTMTSSIDQFIDELGKPFILMEYSMAFTLKTHEYADNQFGKEFSDLLKKEYPTSFQGAN